MSDAMNAEEMIEYVLCESKHRGFTEHEPASDLDPEQQAALERLCEPAIDRLVDDGSTWNIRLNWPAHGRVCRSQSPAAHVACSTMCRLSLPFRWADFAVAASIFIAGTLTLLARHPALT